MRFIHRDIVGSTQDEARALYKDGERGPLWVHADVQTAGRGRRDRSWTSVRGNLYSSAIYPSSAGPEVGALYGFATALAVVDTISHYNPVREVTLKWPNDVLVGGSKVAGILIEREPEALIVGTGINLVSHPDDTPYPATHLVAEISEADLASEEPIFTGSEAVLAILASAMLERFAMLETDGFSVIRRDWLKHAHHLGKSISINGLTGTFSGLSENGALCLERSDGTVERVHAGDVSFG